MSKKNPTTYTDIYLLFPYGSFPGGEWRRFLVTFNTDFHKQRNTTDCPVWYAVSGKGFIVWISQERFWQYDDMSKWRIIISLRGNTSVHGIVLQYFIPYLAIRQWKQFEILMPGSGNIFDNDSDYLAFAKQEINRRANKDELLKYGYLTQDGDIEMKIL